MSFDAFSKEKCEDAGIPVETIVADLAIRDLRGRRLVRRLLRGDGRHQHQEVRERTGGEHEGLGYLGFADAHSYKGQEKAKKKRLRQLALAATFT